MSEWLTRVRQRRLSEARDHHSSFLVEALFITGRVSIGDAGNERIQTPMRIHEVQSEEVADEASGETVSS